MARRNNRTNNNQAESKTDYKHTYSWWLTLQVFLPLAIAIFMWYPVTQEIKGVQFSFAKSFASGDLSLFSSLLFFGVLAEADAVKKKDFWITLYKVISVFVGSVSLIVFAVSKDITIDLDLPKTIGQVFPNNVAYLSHLNFWIGIFAVFFVSSFTLDLKRRQQ